MILLNKSVNPITIKEKCLISLFMNINEKKKKKEEETKLISVYELTCDITLHTSKITLLKHYGKRDLLNTKKERKRTTQTLQKCLWIMHMVSIATHTAVPKNKMNK